VVSSYITLDNGQGNELWTKEKGNLWIEKG
jgi:hypothetical protein